MQQHNIWKTIILRKKLIKIPSPREGRKAKGRKRRRIQAVKIERKQDTVRLSSTLSYPQVERNSKLWKLKSFL